MLSNGDLWKQMYFSINPQDFVLPQEIEEMHPIYKLIIMKLIRPDKMIISIQ